VLLRVQVISRVQCTVTVFNYFQFYCVHVLVFEFGFEIGCVIIITSTFLVVFCERRTQRLSIRGVLRCV
jgi:hypothetical protein